MARRKINMQRSLGAKGASIAQTNRDSAIDQLAGTMSSVDVGFRPTDQRVYQVNLERILPDPSQPRHILPYDLRQALHNQEILATEVIQELVLRAEQGDTVALLVLGGRDRGAADEEDTTVEDTGLLALARSIREVGLRQPLNVYRIDDPSQPDQATYRLGEGERRFWSHHLLMLQGHEEFGQVNCIVEALPNDEELIHLRQEAENAARVDLPALARARSIYRIKERLNLEMGTRVPGENTIKLPSQRELQIAVGQQVKSFTGRAISDRMVRNYLALLNLPNKAMDLAEAGQLTEKQLRPVIRLKTDDEQIAMVQQIVEQKWSGSQVLAEVSSSASRSVKKLREVAPTSIEKKFEKRVLDAAKTVYSLATMPQENYEDAVITLALRAKDDKTKEALQQLRDTLEDILLRNAGLAESKEIEVSLLSVIPPITGLKQHLPQEEFESLEFEVSTGGQILDQLLAWQAEDAILASRLTPFIDQVGFHAEALRAGEPLPLPNLEGEERLDFPDLLIYRVISGASIYWAHELLVKRGESDFKLMKAEVVSIKTVGD